MGAKININPDIITWAIHRAGFELQEFLVKNPNVKDWIEKRKNPTVKQLEGFAKKVYVPFGYLFLEELPKEEISFPFFRTGGNQTTKVSLNVYDTILILQKRQEWLSDYLLENEAEPLSFVGKYTSNISYIDLANNIREILKVSLDWASRFGTVEETLNFITKKIEEAGIIVNFNGIVGNNTHRPISVQECRGFVLVNEVVPFLFVNAADAKAAQLFTIIHELAHVWLGKSAGFDNQNLLPADDPIESLCDKVAAEFLVPEVIFNKLWDESYNIDKLTRYFKVSRIVIARRALDTGKISKSRFFDLYNQFMQDFRNRKENQGGGGDFYLTARKRLSINFANYVNQAVKQDKLLYRDAYKITGLKGDTYQKFVNQHLY